MNKDNCIKTIKWEDIEIPVEYLKQTTVNVNGDDYIRLQQENKKLNGAIQTYDILLKSNVEENKRLKDNWNKLKEYIQKDYDFYDKLIAPEYGCAMGALSRIKDKIQELEQGSDN